MVWNPFRKNRGQSPPKKAVAESTNSKNDSVSTDLATPASKALQVGDADFRQVLAPTRGGLFGAIGRVFQIDRGLDPVFWEELDELLIASDLGAMTTLRLMNALRATVDAQAITDLSHAKDALKSRMIDQLKTAGDGALSLPTNGLAVILVIGVNGVGKTTTIAKLAHWFRVRHGRHCLLAAADTFRAGAIEQLKIWGERTGCHVIAHKAGADPSAVVFDAIGAARSRRADCLIIDTAGRLHTKVNLMGELAKMRRTIQQQEGNAPHETLLVLDAMTGQNAIMQAKTFTETIGVTGVVLTKLDSSAKGGMVFAVGEALGVPVKFVGTGESLDALAPFDHRRFVDALFEPH